MDLSELDGFLAGLIAGPDVVPRDEWLAEVWDNEEPDYLDDAEQEAVEQAIFDRYAAIEAGLDATPLGYSVILWQDEAGTTVAEDWAAGFMQAVSLAGEGLAAGAGRRRCLHAADPHRQPGRHDAAGGRTRRPSDVGRALEG